MFVAKSHRLTTLHTILSTGSPLKPQLFDFVYTDIKSDVVLGSVTGGTDIIACFAGNNVSLPVFRGEIQSLHLGCAIESWNEEGMMHALTLHIRGIIFCPAYNKPHQLGIAKVIKFRYKIDSLKRKVACLP